MSNVLSDKVNDIENSRPGKCKGCYPVLKLPDGDIYEIIKNSLKNGSNNNIIMYGNQIVEKTIYRERIKNCKQCEGLIANTTCKYSGDLVYQTAAKKSQRCYHPGNPLW